MFLPPNVTINRISLVEFSILGNWIPICKLLTPYLSVFKRREEVPTKLFVTGFMVPVDTRNANMKLHDL